jgi:hypothetical protein
LALIKYGVARAVWSNRPLVRLLNKVRSRAQVFDQDFDILFDGFPRSGCTFGAWMLRVTQQDRIKSILAQHKPSVFYWAARIDKPICLALRPPVDAISSWVIFTEFSIQKVIDHYVFFHEILLPDRAKFLVLPFSVITGDYPLVLQLIAMRFGLDLNFDFDIEECRREVFARIDAKFADQSGVIDKSKVSRPDETRKQRSAQLREELLSPRYSAGLERCRELHDAYESEYSRDLARLQSLVRS